MTEVNGPGFCWGRGSPCTTADAVASALPAWNGGRPSTAKYSMAPSAHRSVARRDLAAGGLLGRHVGGRPDDEPGGGDPGLVADGGHAEVGELGPVALGTSTLAGLTSRCTTPTRWAASRAVRTPRPMPAAAARRQRPLVGDDLGEARPGHQLHHQPDGAVLLDDVVDGDDGGVVQAGRGLGLAQGAGAHLVGVLLPGEQLHPLDGDLAAQPGSTARYTVDRPCPSASPSS